MTATPDAAPARPSFADTLAVYLKPRVLIVMFLGFSAGLPLALSGSTLLVWMREAGVDLGTIGLFALVGTPYTIKFLWAPLVDALDVPVLSRAARPPARLAGVLAAAADRRDRVSGASAIRRASPWLVALGALLVATASATQDIVDRCLPRRKPGRERAGRRHGLLRRGLPHRHAGLDRGRAVPGQRLRRARLRQARGLDARATSSWRRWSSSASRRRSSRPSRRSRRASAEHAAHARDNPLKRVAAAASARSPISSRATWRSSVLAFVVLFKFTDAFAGAMTAPFVIDLGFSRNDYAAIIKGVGLAATLIGGFAGGFVARAYPLATSLWIGGDPAGGRQPRRSPGRRWSASITGR